MSLFGDALGTVVETIHGAQGSPTITYTPAVGAPFALVAVFDAAGVTVEVAPGVLQRTGEPALGVVLADFATPPVAGEQVEVSGVAYRVADVDTDGQGGATLRLRRL